MSDHFDRDLTPDISSVEVHLLGSLADLADRWHAVTWQAIPALPEVGGLGRGHGHDVGNPRRGAALVRGLFSRGPSPVQWGREHETCPKKSAKEYPGVGPAEAVQTCGQCDGDRTSLTSVVSAGSPCTSSRRANGGRNPVETQLDTRGVPFFRLFR